MRRIHQEFFDANYVDVSIGATTPAQLFCTVPADTTFVVRWGLVISTPVAGPDQPIDVGLRVLATTVQIGRKVSVPATPASFAKYVQLGAEVAANPMGARTELFVTYPGTPATTNVPVTPFIIWAM